MVAAISAAQEEVVQTALMQPNIQRCRGRERVLEVGVGGVIIPRVVGMVRMVWW
jgi:hypothetical protein